GLSNNVPATLMPASDVATLSLFGYDPLVVYTGRAPLEAAAMGIKLGPNDWAIRCNLVTVENEEMRDFTAGHISSEEGKELIGALQFRLAGIVKPGMKPATITHFREGQPVLSGHLEFHPGVSYRNLMVFRPSGKEVP